MKLIVPFFLLCGCVCAAQSLPSTPVEIPVPDFTSPEPTVGNHVNEKSGETEVKPSTESLAPEPTISRSNPPGVERPSSRIAGPITAKSEFQLFAEDAAGHSLPVYGRQLFEQVPTTFAPMDHVPVPAEYALGPGDELVIRVWGKVELQSRVFVDRNGQIFIPKVGALSVAGIRYQQLESYIRTAIGKLYKDFDLNVTMGQLRSIQIFVLGSARQPGVYTVSSLSTLVNALFVSGGPSATGSMRRIQLRRANQLVTEVDLYDLLRNGDKSHDAQLLSGDVIYISAVGPQAAILGSVNEPGVYELKGDTTVATVLKDVAGLSALASTDRAMLERVENHRRRQVDELVLDAAGLQRQLNDGDILRIFPISPRFENSVTLRGTVAQSGRYEWHEGMRIADLIPNREVLLTRDYWNGQNSLAGIRISSNSSTQARPHWDQAPVERPNRDVMQDVIGTGAEINWEYAAIERRDDNDLTTRVIPFNLGNAIDKPGSPDNQRLRAGDVITIFSHKDVPLPQDKHGALVRIGGEVNAPGVYRAEPGETLRALVVRAGGLTQHSYLYASQLTRVSTRQAQEQEQRISTAQMQKALASRYASASSLNSTSTADQQAQVNAQQALIAQLSSVHPTGRIVLDVNPRAASTDDIPDLPLEDGDSYFVPAKMSTVQVAGAVYNENAFRYQEHQRLGTYLRAAGGPTRQADVKRIYLVRADGTVVSRQNHKSAWGNSFGSLLVLPGDAIVVPTKVKSPNNFLQQVPILGQVLAEAATTGAVVATH